MERAWEEVAILLNDVWHSGCVSSRILWIKFKFSRVKVCVVEWFWNDLDRVVDRVGNGSRLCVLGDLSGWIGNRVRVGITGSVEVPRENGNERKMVEFCTNRRVCVGNIYFKHKSLHNYTKVARGQDGIGLKNMIDLVLVKK